MKRLIICYDGTWQRLDNPYPSNVIKIAQAIKGIADDGIPQIVFYDEGVGTEFALKKLVGGVLRRKVFIGWHEKKNARLLKILMTYTTLLSNVGAVVRITDRVIY